MPRMEILRSLTLVVPAMVFVPLLKGDEPAQCDQVKSRCTTTVKAPKFYAALNGLRKNEKAMRDKWIQDEESWSKVSFA